MAMEALNAAGLSPLSVLAKTTKPRKHLLPAAATIPQFKNASSSVSRKLQCGLVVLSSFMSSEFAKALTYEEALQQSVTSISDTGGAGVLDSITGFAAENPLIIGGGLVVLAVPLVVSQLFSKPKPWGVETAKNAYAKLGADDGIGNAQLIDIRAPLEIKEGGSPDIRGLKKKAVAIAYKGEDKPGFLSKLALKFKEPENTTLFILDK